MTIAREKALGMNFLMAALRGNYQPNLDKLEHEFTLGANNYPITRVATYNALVNYKKPMTAITPRVDTNPDVSFAHTDGDDGENPNTRGRGDRENSGIMC